MKKSKIALMLIILPMFVSWNSVYATGNTKRTTNKTVATHKIISLLNLKNRYLQSDVQLTA